MKSKRRNDRKEWSNHSQVDSANVSPTKRDQQRKVQSSAEKKKAEKFYRLRKYS